MNRALTLVARAEPRVRLRAAGRGDLDDLRIWKNANRRGFFFQGEITAAMQTQWFDGYSARPDDFMFIVEHAGLKVGCMGMRVEGDGGIDVYNIIAAPAAAGKGLMKAAMATMCSYAAQAFSKNIGCQVLKNNPAIGYYRSCGFNIVGDGGGHHVFKLDLTRFQPVNFDVVED